jgi:hypothetical protein
MMDKSRTEQRMDKLTVRLMKLKPDMMLVLRNQHAIMLAIRNLIQTQNGDFNVSAALPVLLYQIKQTDDAISKGRAKDD